MYQDPVCFCLDVKLEPVEASRETADPTPFVEVKGDKVFPFVVEGSPESTALFLVEIQEFLFVDAQLLLSLGLSHGPGFKLGGTSYDLAMSVSSFSHSPRNDNENGKPLR